MAAKVLPASEFEQLVEKYDITTHVTPRFLTKFEHILVKGTRLEQLYHGAPSMLSPEDFAKMTSYEDIVEKEMENGTLPFIILRTLPNGEREIWRFEDLLED